MNVSGNLLTVGLLCGIAGPGGCRGRGAVGGDALQSLSIWHGSWHMYMFEDLMGLDAIYWEITHSV